MSAGRPEGTPSEPPTNTTQSVHKFAGVADRLAMLAPLHRRAALRRAAEACGHTGPLPSLSDLATAEAPPEAQWRMTSYDVPGLPTRAAVEAEAARVLRDVAWRTALPLMPPGEVKRLARREATDRITAAWQRGPQTTHECVNSEAVEEGTRLAAVHGLLLTALRAVLHGLGEAIPRSNLAALADEDVRAEANRRAEAARAHWAWRARLAQSAGRRVMTPQDWRALTESADWRAMTDTARQEAVARTLVMTPHDRRQQCPRDHRRRIRREAGQVRQHLAAALGTVGLGAAPYADDYSLARWKERQEAAGAWAETHVLTGSDGTAVPMSRVVAGSHDAQKARLYAMTLGVDEIAHRRGLIPIFVTVTLPPEWHPSPAVGDRSWTPDRAPHLADAALRRTWARFRALLADRDVATLGLRVWEPHRDGCPHAHALLYVEPEQVETVDTALQTVCPEPVPPSLDSDGKQRRVASQMVIVDRERASPATYVAKYILKTCAGAPGDAERKGAECEGDEIDDQLAHYERHRATASERGWRRFGWLGVHGVQRVWQRLLTTDELPEDAPARVRMAWYALKDGRWADALEALGAVGPRGEGVRLANAETEEHVDRETGEVTERPLLTAYGQPTRRPVAIENRATGWRMPLSRQRWAITKAVGENPNENNRLTIAESSPRSGEAWGAEPIRATPAEPIKARMGLAGRLPAACGPPRGPRRGPLQQKACAKRGRRKPPDGGVLLALPSAPQACLLREAGRFFLGWRRGEGARYNGARSLRKRRGPTRFRR